MARTAGSVITVDNRAVRAYLNELKASFLEEGEDIMDHKVENYLRGSQAFGKSDSTSTRMLGRHTILNMLCQLDYINTNTCVEVAEVSERMGRVYSSTLRCASEAILHALHTGTLVNDDERVKQLVAYTIEGKRKDYKKELAKLKKAAAKELDTMTEEQVKLHTKTTMMLNALSTWNGTYTEEYVSLFTPKGFDIQTILDMPQPIGHVIGGRRYDTSITASDVCITIRRTDGGYEVTSHNIARTK